MAVVINVAQVLERALLDAGIPIDGVSVGDVNTRATWRIVFKPSATAPQRGQGNSILATLDPQDPTTVANIKQDLATGLTNMDALFALGQTAYECAQAPASFPTLLSFRNRFMTLLRNRL